MGKRSSVEQALEVHLEQSGDVPVVRVVGEIDLATAPQLQSCLARIPADTRAVIVDLTAVTFLDSTGLSVLVAGRKRLSEDGEEGDLRLVVSRSLIQRVLDVTGLSNVFPVFATVEEAVRG